MRRPLVILAVGIVATVGLGTWYLSQVNFSGTLPQSAEPTVTQAPDAPTEDAELNTLLKAYNDKKDDPAFLLQLSDAMLQRRQAKKASRYLDEILAINPKSSDALSRLAIISLYENNIQAAKNMLNGLPDDHSYSLFAKALVAIFETRRDDAGTYLHTIISNAPDTLLASNAQKLIDAYREFDYYRDGKPVHLKTLIARAFNQINEPALAIWFLKDILTEKPDYRDAWILLGYAYFNLQQFSSAIDAFQKAYEIDSEKPETQYFLGLAYYALDNKIEAQRFLEYAVLNGFEPKLQAYEKLATLYLDNGFFEKAAKAYENSLALMPNRTPEDFTQPIWIYIDKLGMPERAVRLAKQVVEAHPDSASALTLLAWADIASGDFTEALKNLEQAKTLNPNLASISLNFGRLYEAQGDKEKAKASYKQAYEMAKGTTEGNQAAEKYNILLNQ